MRLRILALAPLLLATLPLVNHADASTAPTGVDVSKYQHGTGKPIDWNAVRRSGQQFAFIKATGGSNRTDPWFAREWVAAGKAGIIRGAYHYADPSRSADQQAAFVVKVVGSTRESRDLGIVLDLETTGGLGPGALAHWTHQFLDGVERRTGRVPILYTYPSFWQSEMRNNRTFGAYPLWLARYGPRPAPLAGWDRWTFWQHTDTGRVPGIVGDVDRSVMCCSASTLQALADGRSVAITRLWKSLGGASGQLGLPLGPETAVPGGWGQVFERGYIASTKSGTFPVLGGVWTRYEETGAGTGPLGVPLAAAEDIALGVVQQRFANGRIIWSQLTGGHAVTGPYLSRWLSDGGVLAPEGLPTSDVKGAGQQFLLGGLYQTPTGVHLVPGAIRDRYEQLGGPTGALGLPLGEVHPALGGRAVDFQFGSLTEVQLAGQSVVL